jgi:hypothetical protein
MSQQSDNVSEEDKHTCSSPGSMRVKIVGGLVGVSCLLPLIIIKSPFWPTAVGILGVVAMVTVVSCLMLKGGRE